MRLARSARLAAVALCLYSPRAALRAQPITAQGTVAVAAPTPVVIGQQTVVHSVVLGEDRPVLVHLPRSYVSGGRTRYPVVYVLDGDAHFASVSAMVDFLAINGRIPEMLVVAVPNTRDRTHDLTPPGDTGAVKFAVLPGSRDSVSQSFPTAGGAPKFRAFITDELATWVDAQYRTAPFRILVGHSFGGLFVLDALAHAPRSFNAFVAVSPSLWWDGGRYEKRLEGELRRAPLAGTALYMTTGAREPDAEMIEPARALAASIESARLAGFRSWYAVMPTETHGSNPYRTTYDALEHIFAGWEAPDAVRAAVMKGDIAPLEAHYAELTKRLGYPVQASVEEINQAGYVNLQRRQFDAAVALFRRNVAATPDYANGWDSLADGLEAQGKLDEAMAAQEKAVRLGEAQQDPSLAAFRAHYDRLRQTVATKR